jgi:hypothetical protein
MENKMNFKEHLIQVGLNESKYDKPKLNNGGWLGELWDKFLNDNVKLPKKFIFRIRFDHPSGGMIADIECKSGNDIIKSLNKSCKAGKIKARMKWDKPGNVEGFAGTGGIMDPTYEIIKLPIGLNESLKVQVKPELNKVPRIKRLYADFLKTEKNLPKKFVFKLMFNIDDGYFQYDIECKNAEDVINDLNKVAKTGKLSSAYGYYYEDEDDDAELTNVNAKDIFDLEYEIIDY